MDANQNHKRLIVRLCEFGTLLKENGARSPLVRQLLSDAYGDLQFLALAIQQLSLAKKRERRENLESMDNETREAFELRDQQQKRIAVNLREMAIEIRPCEASQIAFRLVESEGIQDRVEQSIRLDEILAEMAENSLFLKYVVANCL